MNLQAKDCGFKIKRTYRGLQNSIAVKQNTTTNSRLSQWTFQVGQMILVEIDIETNIKRHHIALVDPIPAGAEIINCQLKGSPSILLENNQQHTVSNYLKSLSLSTFSNHINYRDSHVEVFSSVLWPGYYTFSYALRGTCKGDFIVPPCKIQEMYSPENFGRSNTDFIDIE